MRVGVIMNGVTGCMGTNQHLVRSILAIRDQGRRAGGGGDAIWPEPILVACGEPFPWTLLEGARGVQLAKAGLRSWRERRWVDLPDLRL